MNEVSCRVIWLNFEVARQQKKDPAELAAGLPYSLAHLMDPGKRIGWDHFCILNQRLGQMAGSTAELERLASNFSASPVMKGLQSVLGLVASARTIYWASNKWFGAAMFSIITSSLEDLDDGRIRFTMQIPDEYLDSPEFFQINAGVFRANPRVLGQQDSTVEYELFPRKAVYLISPPPSLTLWARLRNAVKVIFVPQFAFSELGQQQAQLKKSFLELKDANTQIGDQADQLRTVNLLARELTAFTELDALSNAVCKLLVSRFGAAGVKVSVEVAPDRPVNVYQLGSLEGAASRSLPLVAANSPLGSLDLWGPSSNALTRDVLDDLTPFISIALANARSFVRLREYQAGLESKVAERTAQLQQSLVQLTEADRQKTEFFANASHELRTPLTLMLAPLEVLAGQPGLSAEAKAELLGVNRSGYKLLKLVNDLLDLSKIEAGKMTLTMGAVDLAPLLTEVLRPWKTALRSRKITVNTDFDPSLQLAGDGERLEQIALNLVSNAIKFTPDGGTIDVRAGKKSDGMVFFSIQNSGEGIPAEELPTLFGRFTQSTRSKSRRFGSTGLGLPVVRELVELHNGTIAVESDLGAWVRFTVQLPVGSFDAAATPSVAHAAAAELQLFDAAAHRENSAAASPLALASNDQLDLPTLVVAEDNEALRAFVVKNLASTFRVIEAGDGAQALRLIRQHEPDVVLSDLMMPEMDGLELCAALKADTTLCNIPFVLLTARADIDTRLNGFEKGADDYLMKPFHLEELRARLNAQLRLRKLALQMAQREKLAALGAVVAGVAHEIRNPLNGIINALEPLRELMPHASPELIELIDLAIQSSRRVEHISDQLLKQGRAGEGTRGDVDLIENVRLALQLLSHKVGSGVEITSELAPADSVNVIGEAGALHQVWVNLIDNAIQAASPKGNVKVKVSQTNGHATVEVSDDGRGIEPRVLKRMWDPFFTTKDVGSGTGLGLAIVREIVEKHGGQISVDSTVGHGARFTVKLPNTARHQEGALHASI